MSAWSDREAKLKGQDTPAATKTSGLSAWAQRETRLHGGSTKKKGRHGVGGYFQNLASDAKDTAFGIGPGLYELGKGFGQDIGQDWRVATGQPGKHGHHTEDFAKAVGAGYKQQYAPIAHGDFHPLYDRPLGPILDAISVISLGTGAAVKAGALTARAGRTAEILGTGESAVTKGLARTELRAQLQYGRNALLNKLPASPATGNNPLSRGASKIAGADARIARIERGRAWRKKVANEVLNQPYLKVLSRLHGQDASVAAHLKMTLPLRVDLDREIARMRELAPKDSVIRDRLSILERPGVQKLYDNPTPKMMAVIDEARTLGEEQARLLGVDPRAAAERPYLHMRLSRGATWNDARAAAEAQARGTDRAAQAAGQGTLFEMPPERGLSGGPTVEELKAELDAAGSHHPVYLPDVAEIPKSNPLPGNPSGGGVGLPTDTAAMRTNKGSLFHAGQLIMDPSVLNDSFLRSVKYAHYGDVHNALLDHSRLLPRGQKLPPGWKPIRQFRGEKVDPLTKQGAGFEEWANQFLDKKGQWGSKDNPFTVDSLDDSDAVVEAGGHRIVPEQFARQMAGEFTKAGGFTRLMQKGPIKVWRALVLNLRPAWLVNNVVGNTLMYLVHGASPNDLDALARAFGRMVKPGERKEFNRLLEKHFASQTHGTFQETQNPYMYQGTGRARKSATVSRTIKAGKLTLNSLAIIDKKFEMMLRSGKVRAELRRHPELEKRVHAMRQEVPDFYEAANKVLDENPHIVDQIHDRVNDALGDFQNLSPFEKNVIRGAAPFYSWYRAITMVTLKLPLAQPIKTSLLFRVAEVGIEANLERMGVSREDLPDNLRGFIAWGKDPDGRVRGLSTGGVNPFGTVGQLESFVEALASGEPGRAGPLVPGLNPFYASLYEYLVGSNLATGAKAQKYPWYLGGPVTGPVVSQLPQARLVEATTGHLYQGSPGKPTLYDRDWLDEVLRYSGAPYARLSLQRAKEVAAKQQNGPG